MESEQNKEQEIKEQNIMKEEINTDGKNEKDSK